MRGAIIVKLGTSPKEINVKGAISKELGLNPQFVKEISIDSDRPADIELHREFAREVLSNPDAFELEIPERRELLTALERSDKGAVLDSKLGCILSYATGAEISDRIRAEYVDVREGIQVAREMGSDVKEKIECIILASPFAGTGSALVLDVCSIFKSIDPEAKVTLITSFTLCPAGSGLNASLLPRARKNAHDFLKRLKLVERGEEEDGVFYPHYSDGKLKFFPEVEIPAVAPDEVLNIVPKVRSFRELLMVQEKLAKDLVVHGVPFYLPDVENVRSEVPGRITNVIVDYYEFPTERVKKFFADSAFLEQLSVSLKLNGTGAVLVPERISELLGFDGKVEPDWDDISAKLKEGIAGRSWVLKKVEEAIEGAREEVVRMRESVLVELEKEVERKVTEARIGELYDSVEKTLSYVRASIEPQKTSKFDKRVDLDRLFGELEELRKKTFVAFKGSKIEKTTSKIVELLKEYWRVESSKVIQQAKLESISAVARFLESVRDDITRLLQEIELLRRQNSKPIESRHFEVLDTSDLVLADFKPTSLKLDEIRSEWERTIADRLGEKVRESFRPDLGSFELINLREGWKPSNGRASKKARMYVAVIPRYARPKSNSNFRIVQKESGFDITAYRFIFGVEIEEVEVA